MSFVLSHVILRSPSSETVMLLGIVPMLMTVGPASSEDVFVVEEDCGEEVTGDFFARARGTIAETRGPMI